MTKGETTTIRPPQGDGKALPEWRRVIGRNATLADLAHAQRERIGSTFTVEAGGYLPRGGCGARRSVPIDRSRTIGGDQGMSERIQIEPLHAGYVIRSWPHRSLVVTAQDMRDIYDWCLLHMNELEQEAEPARRKSGEEIVQEVKDNKKSGTKQGKEHV